MRSESFVDISQQTPTNLNVAHGLNLDFPRRAGFFVHPDAPGESLSKTLFQAARAETRISRQIVNHHAAVIALFAAAVMKAERPQERVHLLFIPRLLFFD